MPFDSKPEPISNPIVEGLDRAMTILGENGEGWTRFTMIEDTGERVRVCVDGALRMAFDMIPVLGKVYPRENERNYTQARIIVESASESNYPLESWNDQVVRSFPEVRAAMVKARALALA